MRTKIRKALSLVLAAAMCLSLLPASALALGGNVEINEANFPDPTFRAYLSKEYDLNSDGVFTPDELKRVDRIQLDGYSVPGPEKITTLEGIQLFPNLTTLDCDYNKLTSLDLTGCTNLTSLFCYNNQLTSLDLTGCTNLTHMLFSNNRREISHGPPLSDLPGFDKTRASNIQGGNFDNDQVNFTQDTLTYTYDCGGYSAEFTLVCHLPDVAISEANFPDPNFRAYLSAHWDDDKNGVLTSDELKQVNRIDIDGGSLPGPDKITSLEGIRFFPNLTKLDCRKSLLTSLDLTGCSNLTDLDCDYNKLTSLDLTDCPNLTRLSCENNLLTALDLSACTGLSSLDCDTNQLTSLDLTGCTGLSSLYCDNNKLTSLDLTGCTNLTSLFCYNNQLTSLDLTGCTNLSGLDCDTNQLTSLDLTGCTGLTELDCCYNQLTSLDLTCFSYLADLRCDYNQLTSLDLTDCTSLTLSFFSGNTRTVTDYPPLSELTGLDPTRVSNVKGGTFDNGLVDFDGTYDITYNYDCGNGRTLYVTLERAKIVYSNVYVNFRVVNGTWANGSTWDQNVLVELYDGRGTLSAYDVPTGMRPRDGYENGHWDVTPNTDRKGITDGVTYTYSFDRKPISFSDVQQDDYFFEPVKWAVENDVTFGIGNNQFGPDLPCTRAQIVTFLWNSHGQPEPKATVSPFSDVKESDWFFKPIMWAVENDITSGIGNGQFGPNLTCTRAQAMTFLWKDAGRPTVAGEMKFSDVTESDWFYMPVKWAVANKITSGVGGGRFGSEDDCLRAQIVTFMYRVDK